LTMPSKNGRAPTVTMQSSTSAEGAPESKAKLKEETVIGSSDPSTPTSIRSLSVDPALLDEEEAPGLMDDSDSASSEKVSLHKRKRAYVASGGGYNALKTFNGQVYSGMAVGGSHTWNYDQGIWTETKEEPDLWEIDYKATKKRARTAPQGSGAPVGTQYHWLIVAHQYVEKVDANTYETHLSGSKYKLAHKTASSTAWSIPTVKAQREREVELLEDAKRRVQGLPPVLKSEKVKAAKEERGQQKLDILFARAKDGENDDVESSRKKIKRK